MMNARNKAILTVLEERGVPLLYCEGWAERGDQKSGNGFVVDPSRIVSFGLASTNLEASLGTICVVTHDGEEISSKYFVVGSKNSRLPEALNALLEADKCTVADLNCPIARALIGRKVGEEVSYVVKDSIGKEITNKIRIDAIISEISEIFLD